MNASVIPQPDLLNDLDELVERFAVVVNRVRHSAQRDEKRSHTNRKEAKHEDQNER